MKKLITLIFCSLIIFSLCGCGQQKNKNTAENGEDKYMTLLEWTNSGNKNSDQKEEWLKVAVENDNYDGDVLQTGTYLIQQTAGNNNEKSQRIYNFYVTDLDTENPSEVKNDTLPITVGGLNGNENEISLKKGQYLYIQKVSNGDIGHLMLKLK